VRAIFVTHSVHIHAFPPVRSLDSIMTRESLTHSRAPCVWKEGASDASISARSSSEHVETHLERPLTWLSQPRDRRERPPPLSDARQGRRAPSLLLRVGCKRSGLSSGASAGRCDTAHPHNHLRVHRPLPGHLRLHTHNMYSCRDRTYITWYIFRTAVYLTHPGAPAAK
jgi:hypothetical protein